MANPPEDIIPYKENLAMMTQTWHDAIQKVPQEKQNAVRAMLILDLVREDLIKHYIKEKDVEKGRAHLQALTKMLKEHEIKDYSFCKEYEEQLTNIASREKRVATKKKAKKIAMGALVFGAVAFAAYAILSIRQ